VVFPPSVVYVFVFLRRKSYQIETILAKSADLELSKTGIAVNVTFCHAVRPALEVNRYSTLQTEAFSRSTALVSAL